MNIEQYLLTCLAEECAELAQAASKANRFGMDDLWPGKPSTNRQDIELEFNDIVAVMELIRANGFLNGALFNADHIKRKKEKLSRMLIYSAQRNRVHPDHSDHSVKNGKPKAPTRK